MKRRIGSVILLLVLLGLAGCPEMDQQNGSASGGESSSSSSE
jgi:uncharacterized lipoprotein